MRNGPLKIGIIGGSIAACAAAILLRKQGIEVTIFERSSHSLAERGAGIMLPEAFVELCMQLDLLDINIPQLRTVSRKFFINDNKASPGKEIWQQTIAVADFNWSAIYQNLRKRIPDNHFLINAEVSNIQSTQTGCTLQVDERQYYFDYVIAADGIDSLARKQLFPQLALNYAGYVAWRGTIPLEKYMDPSQFNQQAAYYVFPGGHLLVYLIPDAHHEGKTLCNWVMYELLEDSLESFLIDKDGKPHKHSLPPKTLSERHLAHLYSLAKENLPKALSALICATEKPFLQVIFDATVPHYYKNRICFIGDAGSILRPHSASGVWKALADSISLAKAFAQMNSQTDSLTEWNQNQLKLAQEQSALAKRMGEALVTHSPDWQIMTAQLMAAWWDSVVAGKKWYATDKVTLWKTDNDVKLDEKNILSKKPHSKL